MQLSYEVTAKLVNRDMVGGLHYMLHGKFVMSDDAGTAQSEGLNAAFAVTDEEWELTEPGDVLHFVQGEKTVWEDRNIIEENSRA